MIVLKITKPWSIA